MSYRPSTSPYQFPKSGQAWGQSAQSRILGTSLISTGSSKSAGSANRIYYFLKKEKGNDYAMTFFKDASFGPYILNHKRTALIWN
jgi:hypothetical protein